MNIRWRGPPPPYKPPQIVYDSSTTAKVFKILRLASTRSHCPSPHICNECVLVHGTGVGLPLTMPDQEPEEFLVNKIEGKKSGLKKESYLYLSRDKVQEGD